MSRAWKVIPNALDVPFDNSTNGFASDDTQSAIEGTTIAFSDDALQSTGSNNWVTKNNYPFTSPTLDAGDYIIDFTAELGQSDKEKQVGYRV